MRFCITPTVGASVRPPATAMASSDDSGWCTIESGDDVFTELMDTVGVKGVEMEEVYGMDAESWAAIPRPCYGLVFLFKWKRAQYEEARGALDDAAAAASGVFFAKQVINNACGTMALVNILMNRPDVDVGSELGNLKAFVGDFPADMKGEALGNSAKIRAAHNSFARPEPFVGGPSKTATDDDDVFHFIAYVPVGGRAFELDGMQPGPIPLGNADAAAGDGGAWLEVVRPAVQRRIDAFAAGEIHFSLLAMVPDKLAAAQGRKERAETAAAAAAAAGSGDSEACQRELRAATADVESHRERRERWRLENQRRRHNYVPFVFNVLQVLARQGKLVDLKKAAVEKGAARVEAAAKRRAAQGK